MLEAGRDAAESVLHPVVAAAAREAWHAHDLRGGPRSGGQAKRQKKLAKKARQRKAKQRRADWSKPGQGLVEEAEASD